MRDALRSPVLHSLDDFDGSPVTSGITEQNGGLASLFDNAPWAPPSGLGRLRKRLAQHLGEHYGVAFEPQSVFVAGSTTTALASLLFCTLDSGGEVVVSSPHSRFVPELVEMAAGKPKIVATTMECRWERDPRAFARELSGRTQFVLLGNPTESTGVQISCDFLEELVAAVEKTAPRAWFILDSRYRRMLPDGSRDSASLIRALGNASKRLILLEGMAPIRQSLVFLVAPPAVVAAASQVGRQMGALPPLARQQLAYESLALLDDGVTVGRMRRAAEARRVAVRDALAHIEGVRCFSCPGALSVFVDVSKRVGPDLSGNDMSLVVKRLSESQPFPVKRGADYGAQGCVRIFLDQERPQFDRDVARLLVALSLLVTPEPERISMDAPSLFGDVENMRAVLLHLEAIALAAREMRQDIAEAYRDLLSLNGRFLLAKTKE